MQKEQAERSLCQSSQNNTAIFWNVLDTQKNVWLPILPEVMNGAGKLSEALVRAHFRIAEEALKIAIERIAMIQEGVEVEDMVKIRAAIEYKFDFGIDVEY